jgi:hypothetical protein
MCNQVFRQTVKEKGVGGLFTGMGPRVTQTAVMSAVFFSLFEFWKAQLKGCAQIPMPSSACNDGFSWDTLVLRVALPVSRCASQDLRHCICL